ncbi:MAG: antitoxin Xre/MbcA/ParS toxin-binding domain-containing protein [Balneolaceae bacterium]|nr:antitoxin Xre/MbcA/ParS toxin-binding domain-containing protein [Balneolaceae bacterium]
MAKNQDHKENANLVAETAVKYQVNSENKYSLINRAQNGLPAAAFFDLVKITGFSNQELAGLLNLSFKTIQRYQKEGKKLSALNSEQLLKIIALYQKAEEVFGSLSSFNQWLRKPAPGLGGKEPFSFMQTSGGIDLIREELIRIEFGTLG